MEKMIQLWELPGRGTGGILIGKERVWGTTDAFIKSFSALEDAAAWLKKHGYKPTTRAAVRRNTKGTPFDIDFYSEE